MDSYLITILIVSLCIATLLKSLIKNVVASHSSSSFGKKQKKLQLPPGPSPLPLIGSFMWFRKSANLEAHLREMKAKYGPVFALKIGYRPSVIIASHSSAHRALFQEGTIFSDRPESPSNPLSRIFNSNHHTVISASYGPTWRLLRRNLASQMLHPSRSKSYSVHRRWVLSILMNRFLNQEHISVKVFDHFRYGMFCLLVRMCFGDMIQEKKLEQMQSLMFRYLGWDLQFLRFNFFPSLANLFLRYHSKELLQIRKDQEQLFVPLISARINEKREKHDDMVAYVDTLVELQLPDEKRKLNEGEMVSLCTEFINAGTDTTTTALQWLMAHLVKHEAVQNKLYHDIVQIVGIPPPVNMKEMRVIEENELEQMPYLKAVVLEALRIHPPAELVLPHAVSEGVELDGYLVPKKTVVNFMAGSMGRDPEVWEDPMEFKPERFLVADHNDDQRRSRVEFDLTSSREIKMLPFGAGRRICPGANFAMLYLQYFVANLLWYFEWKQVDGQPVDLTEKKEFTIVMKNPLMAHIIPRANRV
uniref:CYP450 n=1 Tax=Gentiana crassa subsp. rigescens TaxID=3097545 RepID=A0A1N7T5P7_9GENT|nr:CYP450 [Gentiana rigescens]